MKLALGTVQFGLNYGVSNTAGQVSLADAVDIVRLAKAGQVDTIDTAAAYGDSEKSLGRVGVEDFKVVTKLPEMPHGIHKAELWVRQQIEASIARLGCKSVYGYLMHRPEELDGEHGEAIAGALREIREDGLAKKIGISVYSPDQVKRAAQHVRIDLVQAPLNLIDRRIVESGEARRLHAEGIELHTRSAFLQGLLLLEKGAVPAAFNPWARLFAQWYDWLENQQISAVKACLDFATSFPEVGRVVVGVDTPSHLKMLLESVRTVPEGEDVAWPDICVDDPRLINPSRWKLK